MGWRAGTRGTVSAPHQLCPLCILASSHSLSLSARPMRGVELTELFSDAGTLGTHTLDSAALIVPSLEGTFARIVRTLGMLVGHDKNMPPNPKGGYPSSRSASLLCRLTSPGLIPGPTNSFPVTSATASASSPSFTGTLLRTNSMAFSLSDSYARKFRTIRGFPSELKLVTRMFHPAGILGTMRRNYRRSMTGPQRVMPNPTPIKKLNGLPPGRCWRG